MRPPNSRLRSRLATWLGVGLVLVSGLLLWQRDFLIDSWRAMQYTPSHVIVSIVDQVGFSPEAQRYFYASQPSLDGTQNFATQCAQHEQSSNIIGCYVNRQIYLFDVDNDELHGIEEVTAAHEMLHAAYDRLSNSQRRQVNDLLSAEIDRHSDDQALNERMAVYQSLAPADQLNEYHSVLATEVADISLELEDYYRRYFNNRQQVVSLYEQYAAVFSQLVAESEALAESLDKQALVINQQIASYNQASANLSASIEQFNRRADRGDFASRADFDRQRQALVARSNSLEGQRQQINQMIDRYNTDLKRYDGLAQHLTTLNNSLDSSLAPAPAVN